MTLRRTIKVVVGFALLLALLGISARGRQGRLDFLREAGARLAHSYEVRASVNRLLSSLEVIEASEYGYVATGDPGFLKSFDAGRLRARADFEALSTLTRDDAAQRARMESLEPLMTAWLERSQANVSLRQTDGFEAAQRGASRTDGRAAMEQIRSDMSEMASSEQQLLRERQAVANDEATGARRAFIIAELASAFLLIGMFTLVIREDRKRRRAQLELDRFFTLSLDMLAIADADGYFKRLSPSFTETLGYTTEELLAQPFIEFVHPEDREKTLNEVARLSQGIATVSFENRYRCRDGSWRWLSWNTRPVAGEGILYASARDMTDLRQSEAARRVSEERYRQLFSSIDEGFCLIEVLFDDHQKAVDFRFLETNPAFAKQTGIADAVGKRMRDIAPAHEEHWFETFGRIALTGEASRFQNRAEQLQRYYDVYAFRIGEPELRQVAILFNDISERHAHENHIAQLNASLQERSTQLEDMNKELESFSYSVSHDLRAPLRSIDGFSQVLLEDCHDQLNEDGRDALERVRKAATSMGELIDALLALSRVTRAEVRTERVDLSAMAAAVAAELQQSQESRPVEFVIDPGVVGWGDTRLLRAVLVNLLGNAWKYSQPRSHTRIEFGHRRQDGEIVYFVRDNGVGFDMAYAGKLFGAFQRLHRKTDFAGTGIGLATVQRIVMRHGGRVWAESAVDRGATFYFTLGKRIEGTMKAPQADRSPVGVA